jgi:hypothetical protein
MFAKLLTQIPDSFDDYLGARRYHFMYDNFIRVLQRYTNKGKKDQAYMDGEDQKQVLDLLGLLPNEAETTVFEQELRFWKTNPEASSALSSILMQLELKESAAEVDDDDLMSLMDAIEGKAPSAMDHKHTGRPKMAPVVKHTEIERCWMISSARYPWLAAIVHGGILHINGRSHVIYAVWNAEAKSIKEAMHKKGTRMNFMMTVAGADSCCFIWCHPPDAKKSVGQYEFVSLFETDQRKMVLMINPEYCHWLAWRWHHEVSIDEIGITEKMLIDSREACEVAFVSIARNLWKEPTFEKKDAHDILEAHLNPAPALPPIAPPLVVAEVPAAASASASVTADALRRKTVVDGSLPPAAKASKPKKQASIRDLDMDDSGASGSGAGSAIHLS